MDPLAHTLVGAALARTSLGKRTRLSGAAAVVGANLADVDVASYIWGPDAALGFRRGWTHGVLALLLLPGALTGVLLLYDAWARRRRPDRPPAAPAWLLVVSATAIATHPLLDWLNTYGVRLLMPFEGRWFYGDTLFIIDPWIWLILGGAIFLGRARNRRGLWLWIPLASLATFLILGGGRQGVPATAAISWVGGLVLVAVLRPLVRTRWPGERFAAGGLALAAAYLLVPLSVSATAPSWVEDELRTRRIAGVEDLMVAPTPADPFHWNVIVETREHYLPGSLTWLGGFTLNLDSPAIQKPRPSPVLDAARGAPAVQGTLRWMRFPFAEIEETAEGYTVHFLDARYVRGRARGFGTAVVRLDHDLRPQDE